MIFFKAFGTWTFSESKKSKIWISDANWPKGLRQRSKGGVFYFSYREKGKKSQSVKSLGVTDLTAAISLAENMKRDLDRNGKLNMSKYEVKSLDDLIEFFMERQDISQKTVWRHKNMFFQLKSFLKKNYPDGLNDVSKIPEEGVLFEYRTQRLAGGEVDGKVIKGASVSTTNQEMGLFKRLFEGCAGMLYGMKNPFNDPPFVKDNPNPKELQVIKADDIPKVLEVAKNYDKLKGAKTNHGNDLYEIFYTYLNTGMRDTELRFLEWGDIDFEDGRIWIRSQKTVEEKRVVEVGRKSLEAIEYLKKKCDGFKVNQKIFKDLADAKYFAENYQFTFRSPDLLVDLKVSDFSDDFKFFKYTRAVEWSVKKKKERAIPMSAGVREILERRKKSAKSNLVFPDEEGGLIRYRLRDRLVRVCKEVGVPEITELHSLRRTFATIARKRGMKIETLQEILGHSSITTTIELYAKYTDEEGKVEMLKLDGAFELEGNRRKVKVVESDEKREEGEVESSPVVVAQPKMAFYELKGQRVFSFLDLCPGCGESWADKMNKRKCSNCGIRMVKDVRFVLKENKCPFCNDVELNEDRECESCDGLFDEGIAIIEGVEG
jgi:integrase